MINCILYCLITWIFWMSHCVCPDYPDAKRKKKLISLTKCVFEVKNKTRMTKKLKFTQNTFRISQRKIHRATLSFWPPPKRKILKRWELKKETCEEWRWTECQNDSAYRSLINPRKRENHTNNYNDLLA